MTATPPAEQPVIDPDRWLDDYGDFLYRYAMKRLRDADASEEVVQETFVAGLRAAKQFQGRGAERAWLLGILKRKIIDYIRARQRVQTVDTEGDDISGVLFDDTGHWRDDPRLFGEHPAKPLENREFWKALQGCIQALPQRQGDAFTLREIEQMPSEEICKVLGVSSSNYWVLLHRARLRLAACLKTKWVGGAE
ncbi:MAG: sigma-70 family RNA polymerase sigma factor [Planctomycetota bacterium]